MSTRPFPTYQRGDMPNAAELTRLEQNVEGLTESRGSGGIVGRTDNSGFRPHNSAPAVFWAQITGGQNPYAWQQGNDNPPGSLAVDLNGRVGTVASGGAYEVNSNTSVPAGTWVKMWLAPAGDHYLFQYSSNPSLEVTGSSGPVIVHNVLHLSVATNNGLTVSDGGPGPVFGSETANLGITNADLTHYGVVTTTDQQLAGNKLFYGNGPSTAAITMAQGTSANFLSPSGGPAEGDISFVPSPSPGMGRLRIHERDNSNIGFHIDIGHEGPLGYGVGYLLLASENVAQTYFATSQGSTIFAGVTMDHSVQAGDMIHVRGGIITGFN